LRHPYVVFYTYSSTCRQCELGISVSSTAAAAPRGESKFISPAPGVCACVCRARPIPQNVRTRHRKTAPQLVTDRNRHRPRFAAKKTSACRRQANLSCRLCRGQNGSDGLASHQTTWYRQLKSAVRSDRFVTHRDVAYTQTMISREAKQQQTRK